MKIQKGRWVMIRDIHTGETKKNLILRQEKLKSSTGIQKAEVYSGCQKERKPASRPFKEII